MYLVATSTGDTSHHMAGTVQSYNISTGALVLAVDSYAGATARADWVLGVAAASAAAGLVRQVVTSNTACVVNVAYIVATAGITLTLPTSWHAGDRIQFLEAIGQPSSYTLAFGSTKLRSATPGTKTILASFGGTPVLTYQDSTRGLV